MSSILRRSAGLARASHRSLGAASRTSLRTPRLLRTTSTVWSVQPSRYYSKSKKPSQSEDGDKEADDVADKPKVQSTHSPGPANAQPRQASARGNDDKLPLPEGWVHVTEEQIRMIEAVFELGPFKISKEHNLLLRKVKQTGVPREVLELAEKMQPGSSVSMQFSDIGKAMKGFNALARHLASLEFNNNHFSRPSQSYQQSFSQSSDKKPKDKEKKDQEEEDHEEEGQEKEGQEKEGQRDRKSQDRDQPQNDKREPKSEGRGSRQKPSPDPNSGNNPWQNDWLTTAIATGVAYYLYSSISGQSGREITWQELNKNFLEKGLVEKLVVVGHKVVVELNREATQSVYPDSAATRAGFNYYFSIASVDGFERRLEEAQNELGIPISERIPVSYAPESNLMNLLLAFGPTVLLVGLLLYASRRGPGGAGSNGLFGFSKSKAKRFVHETAIKVKFSDVAGLDEAKQEILEFVSFLKNPEKFQKLGAKIPRGAILAGPPGTGKTLLAKATAGESGVPFFSVSGSEFVEMFVGVGASRVRDLFATARRNAPCIVFIDEIDAIGRSRASGQRFGGGNDEREATLNQILTEMDGFNTTEQIVVLAGTNRVEILDKALLRPGRFDRHINIDAPTMAGRQDIFKVYLKKIVTSEDIEYLSGRLASLTPGFAGADIANCVNEAALIAARSNATTIVLAHFEQAIERVVGGLERKSLVLDPLEKKTVAYHEAGHAICGWYFQYADPLLKVSIIPRGKALGYAQYSPGDAYLLSYKQLMDRMAMTLGGRISEELHFPTITTGASDDFSKVTRMATSMVTKWGMSDKIGPLHFQNDENNNKPFSETTGQLIDAEIKRIVEEAYNQCKTLLTEKKKEIGILAEELLKNEVLVRDDLVRLLGPRPFDDRNDFAKYFGEEAKKPLGGSTPPPKDSTPPSPPSPSPAVFQQLEGEDQR